MGRGGVPLDDAGAGVRDGSAGWGSRGLVMALFFGTALVVAAGYAGVSWAAVVSMVFKEGLIAGVWVLSAGLGGWVVVEWVHLNGRSNSRSSEMGGGKGPASPALQEGVGADEDASQPLRVVTATAMGLGSYSLAALLMGLMGVLNRWTVFLLPLVSVALFVIWVWRRHGNVRIGAEGVEQWLRAPAGWGWVWLAAAPVLGLALVAVSVPPVALWPGDPHPYDVLEYHLQVPREWYEAGRITGLEHNVFSFFPFNSEMQFLLGMHLMGGPWEGMYLAQNLSLMQMVLVVAAVWGAVKGLREDLSPMGAAIAGVAAAGTPWLLMLGTVAYNEAGLLLYSTLALAWLARGVVRRSVDESARGTVRGVRWRDGLMAGLMAGVMAGLAAGTKYTAVPLLLVAAPVMAVLVAGWRRAVFAALAAYLAAALVVFSPWLIRNLVWTGNPVFPEGMQVFGRGHFSEAQVERWAAAHGPREEQKTAPARAAALWREVLRHRGYGYALVPLGVVCGIAALERRAAFLLANLAALAVFWLGFTHLQSRFFVMAIPLCAVLMGLASRRLLLGSAAVAAALLPAGLLFVHQQMGKARPLLEHGVVAVEDLSALLPAEVDRVLREGTPVALVGEAQAFKYPKPMTQLRYRTVFDVKGDANDELTDAWLGPNASLVRKTHNIVIVPDEVRRLSRTYRRLPAAPQWASEMEPIILRPKELR